jgi:hypothetical protein
MISLGGGGGAPHIRKRPLKKPRIRGMGNIGIDLKKIGWELGGGGWVVLARNCVQRPALKVAYGFCCYIGTTLAHQISCACASLTALVINILNVERIIYVGWC